VSEEMALAALAPGAVPPPFVGPDKWIPYAPPGLPPGMRRPADPQPPPQTPPAPPPLQQKRQDEGGAQEKTR